ncbi:MAG: outer membrane protein transport protein [Pseudomonadota bacterium]
MNNNKKYLLSAVLAGLSSISLAANEARLEIPSSFNPVGSGARALGLGGAFIAVADDATAASWNPGALIQLRRPEFAIVASHVNRSEDYNFGTNPEASGSQSINNNNLNYLSASIPCSSETCGKNMVFSINYQNLYNFDRKMNFTLNDKQTFTGGFQNTDQSINMDQKGDLYAIGLAYSVQATDALSLGFTLNFWEDFINDNEWVSSYNNTDLTTDFDGFMQSTNLIHSIREERYAFSGFNVNLGVLLNVYEKEEQKIMLGLVLKTPFTADITRTKTEQLSESIDGETPNISNTSNTYNEELDMPMSFGIGLSYQFSDQLTFAGDIYRTSWDKFEYTDHLGNKTSPISNKTSVTSDIDATYQVRMGAEYRIISQEFGKNYIIPLRVGLFYDPAPAEGSPDEYYGFSLGTGIAYQHLVFDIAYQYRFGNNVNTQILTDRNFSQDVSEHTVYGSMFYRF